MARPELRAVDPNDLIRPSEAARLLDVEPRTLANYRRDGKIDFVQYNARSFRYLKSSIREYIDAHYQPALNFCE